MDASVDLDNFLDEEEADHCRRGAEALTEGRKWETTV
jgi:hypothetical protein